MRNINRKIHWEKIYNEKQISELSWYEKKPKASLHILKKFNLPETAKIIDIGGGDSLFADNLIDLGYKDITVLDISKASLERAKLRLGNRITKIQWINSDVINFNPDEKYDLWHDRAAFHFLTSETEIKKYIKTIKNYIKPGGYLIIGTFSENGPEKLKNIFRKIKCITVKHKTPFDTIQNFIFCSFQRLSSV